MRLALVLLLIASPVAAQSVKEAPDIISWGTAAANPIRAGWQALSSSDQACRLTQLAVSAAITNSAVLLIKQFVKSDRPCAGCARDGMPSGHTANSFVGSGVPWGSNGGWAVSANVSLSVLTGVLRHEANRHTWRQTLAGGGIGIGGEVGSRLLVRCAS